MMRKQAQKPFNDDIIIADSQLPVFLKIYPIDSFKKKKHFTEPDMMRKQAQKPFIDQSIIADSQLPVVSKYTPYICF